MYHMMDMYMINIPLFFFILNTNHYSVKYQFDKINTRNFLILITCGNPTYFFFFQAIFF